MTRRAQRAEYRLPAVRRAPGEARSGVRAQAAGRGLQGGARPGSLPGPHGPRCRAARGGQKERLWRLPGQLPGWWRRAWGGAEMGSDEVRVLDALTGQVAAELLARSHLLAPEQVADALMDTAGPMGVTKARVYLADLE